MIVNFWVVKWWIRVLYGKSFHFSVIFHYNMFPDLVERSDTPWSVGSKSTAPGPRRVWLDFYNYNGNTIPVVTWELSSKYLDSVIWISLNGGHSCAISIILYGSEQL